MNDEHDRTSYGKLEWVGGFSACDADLRLIAHLARKSPLIEKAKSPADSRKPSELSADIRLPLRRLGILRHGEHYAFNPALQSLDAAVTEIDDDDCTNLQHFEENVTVDDSSSSSLTYENLCRRDLDAADVVASWAPCARDVSFFVAKNDSLTLIIPTFSILRQCFYPSTDVFRRYLTLGESYFTTGGVIFDGLRFRKLGAFEKEPYCYPMRVKRNIDRAQFELSQILPRANAYFNRYGTCLPLLIRTPFTGTTLLTGSAFVAMRGKRRIALFPREIRFEVPKKFGVRKNLPEKAFAPQLAVDGVALPNAGRAIHYTRLEYSNFFRDVRNFGRISNGIDEWFRLHPKAMEQYGPIELEEIRAVSVSEEAIRDYRVR